MRRSLWIIITLALLCATASGQSLKQSDFTKPQPIPDRSIWKPYGPMTIAATSACIGGQMSDVASSTGYEANGFLRGSDGRMNRGKAIPLKLALCAIPLLWEKKAPKWVRITMRAVQFTGGGIGLYDAIRNWKVNGRSR